MLRGTVPFRLGRKKVLADPGQRITVPAGTAHKFWNAGEKRRTSCAKSGRRCSSSS